MRILFFILLSLNAYSFSVPDTTIGLVGEEAAIMIDISDDNISIVSGRFKISNKTMFYPKRLESETGVIEEFNLKVDSSTFNRSFSIYDFSFVYEKSTGNQLQLIGEMLAGNDTITTIEFYDINVNGSTINDTLITYLSTDNRYGNLIYVQRARILNVFPQPLVGNKEFTVEFEIHSDRRVKFLITTIDGRELEVREFESYSKGIHQERFRFETQISSGVYQIVMDTDGFDDFKQFVFIK